AVDDGKAPRANRSEGGAARQQRYLGAAARQHASEPTSDGSGPDHQHTHAQGKASHAATAARGAALPTASFVVRAPQVKAEWCVWHVSAVPAQKKSDIGIRVLARDGPDFLLWGRAGAA